MTSSPSSSSNNRPKRKKSRPPQLGAPQDDPWRDYLLCDDPSAAAAAGASSRLGARVLGAEAAFGACCGITEQLFGKLKQDSAEFRIDKTADYFGGLRSMPSRAEIYRTNAERCRQQAALAENADQRKRLLKLADQWAKMADKEAKQHSPRYAAILARRRKPR